MRGFAWVVMAALPLLAGCVTPPTYGIPAERAPASWYGNAGVALLGPTIEAASGELGPGAQLLTYKAIPVRTGRLTEAVTLTPLRGDPITIPTGTAMIAEQYSLTIQTTYNYVPVGSARNINAVNDPIEWCVADSRQPALCAFWQGDQALYIPMVRHSARMMAQPIGTAGTLGPVPVIEETPPDLSNAITHTFVLERFDNRAAFITHRIADGAEVVENGRPSRYPWRSSRQVGVDLAGIPATLQAISDPILAVGFSIDTSGIPGAPTAR